MSETTSSPHNIHISFTDKLNRMPYDALKRGIDVLAAALGLLMVSPFFLYVAWLIRKDSPGPVFHRCARVGKEGRLFQMLKFRTMYERPESYAGPKVTAQDDPRVTRLGRWLRDTKLNELPQLVNVLRGEMSLVGPRPEDPAIVDGWPEAARRDILAVRPGMTSPASVVYRDEENLLSGSRVMATYLDEILPSKMRLDQLYVRHRSLWSDLDVLFWTLATVAPLIEAHTPPEEMLFAGPIWRLMRRYVSWFTVDVLVTFVALGLSGLAWRTLGPLDVGRERAVGLAVGFAVLYSLVGAFYGVQKTVWAKAPAGEALSLVFPTLAATVIALLSTFLIHKTGPGLSQGIYWSPQPLLPPLMILMAAGLAFAGFVLVRYRVRLATGLASRWVRWRGLAKTGEKVLVVGGGETGQFAAWMLQNGRYANSLHVVGLVDDDLFKQGERIQGVEVLGKRSDIPELVRQCQVEIIVFAIHNISATERREVMRICTSSGARVVWFPDIHAALRRLGGRGGGEMGRHGGAGTRRQGEAADLLPCHVCLTRVSPMRVDEWLARLEGLVEKGEVGRLGEEIASLRRDLRGDVKVQVAANLGDAPID